MENAFQSAHEQPSTTLEKLSVERRTKARLYFRRTVGICVVILAAIIITLYGRDILFYLLARQSFLSRGQARKWFGVHVTPDRIASFLPFGGGHSTHNGRYPLCQSEQFDAIRTPISMREIFGLLGPSTFQEIGDCSSINWTHDINLSWGCEDGRTFRISNPQSCEASLLDFEGFPDNSSIPDLGLMSLSRNRRKGYWEHYLIPPRKKGEVEEAIKKLGPQKSAESI